MGAIFKREFKAYFSSPLAYFYLAIMVAFSGFYFWYMLSAQVSQITYVFSSMMTIVILGTPILTMRLLSEDKKLKTDQLLVTSPVNISGIVFGKYFAALLLLLIGIAPLLIYTVILMAFAAQDWNVILGNFIALFLLGASLIAIGLMISAMTESQVVAGLVTIALMMVLMMFDMIASALPEGWAWAAAIFQGLSFMSRYSDFSQGILNISHILFFVSIAGAFLFLTDRVLEKKRWS